MTKLDRLPDAGIRRATVSAGSGSQSQALEDLVRDADGRLFCHILTI